MGRLVSFSSVIFVVLAVMAVSCGSANSVDRAKPLADHGVVEQDENGCDVVERVAAVVLELGVVQETSEDANDHVLCPVGYETSPPMSGDHFPAWQNCGFYTEPLMDEVAVHSLEHGAVWISYDPDLNVAERDAISALVATDPHLLAAPYPGLANPIVLTAWKRQVAVERIGDDAVADFLDDQLGRRSMTAPEAGASCSEAIGTPPFEPMTRYDEAFAQFS
ncbi:MAG: DUF3105 domain-containing protein [Acidimicrobiales bacterium]|nr:DUF3105 domain-containing protein [Acidimicrobiales bacterium]MDG2219165.1 DUF3105 domain-containing protein [Acidimicrobiales bacterium]